MSGEYFTRTVCTECNNRDRCLGELSCNHCSDGFVYTKVESSTPPGTEVVPEGTLREELAALAHEQWSGWMKYLFSKCSILVIKNNEREALIPPWAVDRWRRQMETPYHKLSEQEKESDRKEADRVLAILTTHRANQKDEETT